MKLVDANVLLYAVNEASAKHAPAERWLNDELSGAGVVGLTWLVLLAFLRLSTRTGLFPRPLPIEQALTIVRTWTNQPQTIIVQETPRHLDVLASLLAPTGGGGNLTSDAHLAALAIEHHATVVTFDNDFGRFTGVQWVMPQAI